MWDSNQNNEETKTGKTEGSKVAAKVQATIGTSISVQGEITGEEDILVEGTVEGTINLRKNIVTVAKTGRVRAHIYGVVIHVEGDVTGDLFGTEQVIIHKSGKVLGNITSPRICVEDGAKIKGSMNTEAPSETATVRSIEVSKLTTRSADLLPEAATTAATKDSARSKNLSSSTNGLY